MRGGNLQKKELHVGRHMIQIHIVVELVTVLIESNDSICTFQSTMANLKHANKYNGYLCILLF